MPKLGRRHYYLAAGSYTTERIICGFSLMTVAYDAFFLRRAYLINIAGVLLINISSPLRFIIANSPGWQTFVHWIVG